MSSADAGRLWLVGCGNMGRAMLERWLAIGAAPDTITVIDPSLPDLPEGVTVTGDVPEGGPPDVVVLAVKPQMLDRVAEMLGGVIAGAPLLVSILAGVEEAALAKRFAADAIVRAMPNLPVGIARGVVALHSDSADQSARDAAEALMAPLGLVEWIEREELFHAVTALSGSGPGFVYRFIEAMAAAGAELGLPADQAERFAIATVEGAAALAGGSDDSPAALAERVASPGGTTRAGLDVLDAGDAIKRLVGETLSAAARRSSELAEAARK